MGRKREGRSDHVRSGREFSEDREVRDDNGKTQEAQKTELSEEDLEKVAGGVQSTSYGATPGDYNFEGHVFRKLKG